MQPARQVADLGDGRAELGGRIVEQGRRSARRLARQIQAHRQGHEALLRAVVQVALHPPALGVGGLHDALPRRATSSSCARTWAASRSFSSAIARDRPDRLDEARVLELDRRVVDQQRQQLAVALQASRSRGPAREPAPAPVGVDEALARRRGERDPETRVAQGPGQDRLQATDRYALPELQPPGRRRCPGPAGPGPRRGGSRPGSAGPG